MAAKLIGFSTVNPGVWLGFGRAGYCYYTSGPTLVSSLPGWVTSVTTPGTAAEPITGTSTNMLMVDGTTRVTYAWRYGTTTTPNKINFTWDGRPIVVSLCLSNYSASLIPDFGVDGWFSVASPDVALRPWARVALWGSGSTTETFSVFKSGSSARYSGFLVDEYRDDVGNLLR